LERAAVDPEQLFGNTLRQRIKLMNVFIYGFEGTYSGSSSIEFSSPEEGATHKAMLFLRQVSESVDFDLALAGINEFGFTDIQSLRGNQLKVESMNDPKMAVFSKYYEEALETGSSLVWYP
jgi:hypothetical protein